MILRQRYGETDVELRERRQRAASALCKACDHLALEHREAGTVWTPHGKVVVGSCQNTIQRWVNLGKREQFRTTQCGCDALCDDIVEECEWVHLREREVLSKSMAALDEV